MKQGSVRIISLITILAATTALGGCDMIGGMSNPLSSSGRPEQKVIGHRRAPMLNPTASAAVPVIPVTPALIAPSQAHAAAPTPPSRETDPYDYYDTKGNEVEPKAAAAPAPQGASASQGGFFTRMMNKISGKQEPAPARKPIPGNPYYSKDTSPAAPMAPAPQEDAPGKDAVSAAPQRSDNTQKPDAAVIAAPTAAADTQTAPAGVPRPWYSQIFSPDDQAKPDMAPVDDKDSSALTPDASSRDVAHNVSRNVLPTAADRAAEKAEAEKASAAKTGNEQQLAMAEPAAAPAPAADAPVSEKSAEKPAADNADEQDHKVTFAPYRLVTWMGGLVGHKEPETPPPEANAPTPALSSVPKKPEEFTAVKEEKTQKMEELRADHDMAQEQKATLDSEPSQLSATPVVSEEKSSPAPAADADMSKSGSLVLLGHASALPPQGDITLPPPTPLEKTVPADAPAAAAEKAPEPQAAPAPAVAEAPAPQKEPEQVAVTKETPKSDVAAQAPAPQEKLAPLPVLVAAPEPAPTTSAAPVTTISQSESKKADAVNVEASPTDALPSPSLLEQVSVLPPSRYQARQQQ